jgi:hypothetical protein
MKLEELYWPGQRQYTFVKAPKELSNIPEQDFKTFSLYLCLSVSVSLPF